METLYKKVAGDLINNGFIKVENLDRWFINFQGRTYYVFKDGGKWWVLINKKGSDIKLNQTGFDSFTEISDLLNALSLNEIFPTHTAQLQADKEDLTKLKSIIEDFRDRAKQSAEDLNNAGLEQSAFCSQAMEMAYKNCLIEIESLIQKMKK